MRIKNKFAELKQQNRAGLVTYIMSHDPDLNTSSKILNALPEAGADIIELGMPFSDPMADGAIIQKAAVRALKSKPKLDEILELVENFRKLDNNTPIILMGYYNPVQKYGLEKFVKNAKTKGVDGFIIVDLPPEEDNLLLDYCDKSDLALIKLTAPTTNESRLKTIAKKARGFIYYVSVTGVTGGKSASAASSKTAISKIRQQINLPVVVGFGIKTASDVKAMKDGADAVVVGSSLVDKISQITKQDIKPVLDFVTQLKQGLL